MGVVLVFTLPLLVVIVVGGIVGVVSWFDGSCPQCEGKWNGRHDYDCPFYYSHSRV